MDSREIQELILNLKTQLKTIPKEDSIKRMRLLALIEFQEAELAKTELLLTS